MGADLANLTMKAAIHCIRRNAAGVIDLEEDDIPPDFIASLRINMAVSHPRPVLSSVCYALTHTHSHSLTLALVHVVCDLGRTL